MGVGLGGGSVEAAGREPERFGAVEVVGVDDGERAGDDAARGKHGVGGAPGLLAVGRRGETRRQVVEVLHRIAHVRLLLPLAADDLAKVLLEVAADHEDDAAEAGVKGVVDAVV